MCPLSLSLDRDANSRNFSKVNMLCVIPKKSFYFVRHGESEANRRKLICGGGNNTPLTDIGRQQARNVQGILEKITVDKPRILYYSDLSRASETAEALNANLKLPFVASPYLREHVMGDWEDKPWCDIAPRLQRGEDPERGETFMAFYERVSNVLTTILSEHDMPLIVAHGGIWRALASLHGYKPVVAPKNAVLYYFKARSSTSEFPWALYSFEMSATGDIVALEQSHLLIRDTAGAFTS